MRTGNFIVGGAQEYIRQEKGRLQLQQKVRKKKEKKKKQKLKMKNKCTLKYIVMGANAGSFGRLSAFLARLGLEICFEA